MRAILTQVVSDIKITKEEKETLLKADKILKDIFEILFESNDYLNDDMIELFNIVERNDLEYIVNNLLELE